MAWYTEQKSYIIYIFRYISNIEVQKEIEYDE